MYKFFTVLFLFAMPAVAFSGQLPDTLTGYVSGTTFTKSYLCCKRQCDDSGW